MTLVLLLASTTALALVLSLALALTIIRSNGKPGQKNLKKVHRFLTFRISNIPRHLTKDQFRDILFRLHRGIAPSEIINKPNVLNWSYTPAAASSLSERFWVATVTFDIPPAPNELETAIKREIGGKADRLNVDLDIFGLTPLADPEENVIVDIIAVTGLAGHAFGSWKAKGGPDIWLRDFLPGSMPYARILTYGYETKLPGSQSNASILELSRTLLESVKTTRNSARQNRPLIFIGHSLGGLVVKQALVQAAEGGPDDKAVFMSCYAVFFFAVPNRGLDNNSLMAMVRGQPNEDLVRNLSGESAFLNLLHAMFYKHFILDGSKIMSVFETQKTPTVKWSPETTTWERTGREDMMVPQQSAIHAGPNEKDYDHLPIDANHSDIVKFSDQSQHDYLIIQERINKLVAEAPAVIKSRFARHRQELSRLEKRYVEALQAPDYASFRKYSIDEPTPDTLGWFLNNERFRSWQTNEESSILWIKGSAGRGKTILTKFLLNHLETSSLDSNNQATVIYFFFYDQDDHLRTVNAALRSLIKQLLLVREGFQVISEKFDIENSTIPEASLCVILEEILRAPIFTTIFCVVDALDECQDDESRQEKFLNILTGIAPSASASKQNDPVLKILLISRPTVALSRKLDQHPFIYLRANPQDLEIFIRSRINALSLRDDLQEPAIKLLTDRAEETFLWISIILKKLKTATTMLSQADMEQIITKSPSDLTDLYEDIVSQIMNSDDMAQQKLLLWVAYGRRALTLAELDEALSIQDDSDSMASTEKHRIGLTENNITSAAGVILETKERRVYLIHQSAKDFLLKSGRLATAEFCRSLHPSAYLAKVCMAYVCFKDFESGPCGSRHQLDERIRQHPLFQYAARNWHRHIRGEDIEGNSSTIRRLTEPGSPTLLAWGEAAEVRGLDGAANILDVATKANIPWLAEFQPRGDIITEEMAKEAARRGAVGWNTFERLLSNHDVQFSEGAVRAIVQHFDQGMVRLMLDNHVTIVTPALIAAATTNRHHGSFVLDLLLKSQDRFVVTADLVKLAVENHESGKDVIELLLHKDGTHVPEDAVAAIAARFGPETMKVWLDSREDTKVTELVFDAITRNKLRGKEIITLLLEQRDQDFLITEEIVETIEARLGMETIAILIEKRGQAIPVTEEIVKTIAKQSDREMMALLLEKGSQDIRITEEMVKAAAGNSWNGKEVMTLLLDRRGDEITVTEEVVKVCCNVWSREGFEPFISDWSYLRSR